MARTYLLLLLVALALTPASWSADAQSTAGFVRSPLSQSLLLGESTSLHCEVVGVPTPEVQWWFAPAQAVVDRYGSDDDDEEDVDKDGEDSDDSDDVKDETDDNDDNDVDREKTFGRRETTTLTQPKDLASSSSKSSSSLPIVPWLSVTDVDRDPNEKGSPGSPGQRGAASGRGRRQHRHTGRTFSQLWDGDRGDLVSLVTAYGPRGAQSRLVLREMAAAHTGTYECRASNAPGRNQQRIAGPGPRGRGGGRAMPPPPRWVRAQAVISVVAHPEIHTSPAVQLSGPSGERNPVTLRCDLAVTSGLRVLGHTWLKNGNILTDSEDSSSSLTTTYSVTWTPDYRASGLYTCSYHTEPTVNGTIAVNAPLVVEAPRLSESADEGDSVSLRCDALTYPPPTAWTWHRQQDDGTLHVIGSAREGEVRDDSGAGDAGTGPAVVVVLNGGHRSELRLGPPLVSVRDAGLYVCNASTGGGAAPAAAGAAEEGEGAEEAPHAWGAGRISLRVRARLAALWPFLGIVGEVVLLTGAILLYERRQVAKHRLANGAGKLALTPGTTRR